MKRLLRVFFTKLLSALGLSPPECTNELKNIGTNGNNSDTNNTTTFVFLGPVYVIYNNAVHTDT